MPITLTTKTYFHCTCLRCKYQWDTMTKPKRCAGCKCRNWNGEDHRRIDPYVKVPLASQIAVGTEAPQLPSPEPLLELLLAAREVIDQIIICNPCNHEKDECVCKEKRILASIDHRIEKLKVMRPTRSTYLVQKRKPKTKAHAGEVA